MKNYQIPTNLSDYQREMYCHLIDWKRKKITEQPGRYAGREYDALFPDEFKGKLPHLYAPIRERFFEHQKKFCFKTHKFADHLASSQVACANLFLPIMVQPEIAPAILKVVKPDLATIATDQLDSGFRIEFWDELQDGPKDQKGMLGDHNRSAGTDADFAVAYRNHASQLWRNQLLAIAIESSNAWPYKRVFFSVVHHPKNKVLKKSMQQFEDLTGKSGRFFSFTSDRLAEAAKTGGSSELQEWADWYEDLYFLDRNCSA